MDTVDTGAPHLWQNPASAGSVALQAGHERVGVVTLAFLLRSALSFT